jgi:hypothetical protein
MGVTAISRDEIRQAFGEDAAPAGPIAAAEFPNGQLFLYNLLCKRLSPEHALSQSPGYGVSRCHITMIFSADVDRGGRVCG